MKASDAHVHIDTFVFAMTVTALFAFLAGFSFNLFLGP
jgi:hypothetical protein